MILNNIKFDKIIDLEDLIDLLNKVEEMLKEDLEEQVIQVNDRHYKVYLYNVSGMDIYDISIELMEDI